MCQLAGRTHRSIARGSMQFDSSRMRRSVKREACSVVTNSSNMDNKASTLPATGPDAAMAPNQLTPAVHTRKHRQAENSPAIDKTFKIDHNIVNHSTV